MRPSWAATTTMFSPSHSQPSPPARSSGRPTRPLTCNPSSRHPMETSLLQQANTAWIASDFVSVFGFLILKLKVRSQHFAEFLIHNASERFEPAVNFYQATHSRAENASWIIEGNRGFINLGRRECHGGCVPRFGVAGREHSRHRASSILAERLVRQVDRW